MRDTIRIVTGNDFCQARSTKKGRKFSGGVQAEREGTECYTVGSRLRRRLARGAVIRRLPVGEWLSLVEHLVRDQGVGGSNPLSPTNSKGLIGTHSGRNWAQLRESEAQSHPLCRHRTKHPIYLHSGTSVAL